MELVPPHIWRAHMKKLVLVALAAGAVVTAGAASAQTIYYSGPGYGAHIGPRYEDPYYGPRYRPYARYEGGYYGERRSYRSRRGACPPHYTIQDGVCKPYRGL